MQAPYGDILTTTNVPACLPLAPPPFTLADIKNAIPRHCFERSLVMGLFHLAIDLVIVAAFAFAATFIDHPDVPALARYVLWPAYWYAQVSKPATTKAAGRDNGTSHAHLLQCGACEGSMFGGHC